MSRGSEASASLVMRLMGSIPGAPQAHSGGIDRSLQRGASCGRALSDLSSHFASLRCYTFAPILDLSPAQDEVGEIDARYAPGRRACRAGQTEPTHQRVNALAVSQNAIGANQQPRRIKQ